MVYVFTIILYISCCGHGIMEEDCPVFVSPTELPDNSVF